ncbi:MAG: ATP-binding cassette domain-containing protein, partial [Pseudomonadota bacterium]
MTILQAKGLTRRFGGVLAVDGVDLDITQGEVRALIGPNGAGKSTLVGMLCGRIEASAGQVVFQGDDITGLPGHQRVSLGMAYTFQITSIFSRLSLYENVALAVRRRHPGSHEAVHHEVEEALSAVGLADRMDEIAGDLSYGHQR